MQQYESVSIIFALNQYIHIQILIIPNERDKTMMKRSSIHKRFKYIQDIFYKNIERIREIKTKLVYKNVS